LIAKASISTERKMFKHACKTGLEAVVSKVRDRRYQYVAFKQRMSCVASHLRMAVERRRAANGK